MTVRDWLIHHDRPDLDAKQLTALAQAEGHPWTYGTVRQTRWLLSQHREDLASADTAIEALVERAKDQERMIAAKIDSLIAALDSAKVDFDRAQLVRQDLEAVLARMAREESA
jgi:hypothetical protein